MRVVVYQPPDTRVPFDDPMCIRLRRWRREQPDRFHELAWAMGYEPPRDWTARSIAVTPDAFERGNVPPLACLLKPTGPTLEELEREAIIAALQRHGGQQKAAARDLGITARVMGYKVRHVHRLTPVAHETHP